MSYTKDPLFGNYLGIVVNKEDPEYRGRVQIWIPHLTNTLHSEWNDELKNKSFKHIHDSGSLTPKLVEELRKVLPWAECAAPIIGGGTSATYNDQTGITSTNPHKTLNESSKFLGSTQDYGDKLLIPVDGGNIPNTAGLNKEFTNRLNGLYKDLNDSGYYIGITSGARIGSSGAHNATLENGAIAVDVRVRGNGKYGNILINNIDGNNPAAADAGNYDTPEFNELLKKHGLHQPLHPKYGDVKGIPEKWHIEPIETRGGSRGSSLFSSVSNTLNKTASDLNEESVTKTAMDAAEIPGTSVNPAANAKTADRTVKDAYNSDLSSRYDSLSPNVKKVMYGLGMAETGFNPSEATSNDDNSYRNYVRFPDGTEKEVESLNNLPAGTIKLEIKNKWVAEEYAKNGGDLAAAQKEKADSGYYRTSEDMNKLAGVTLNTGTPAEQAVKNWDYIKRFHPDAAAAAESGNTQEAFRLLGEGRWPSLNPKYITNNLDKAIAGSNKSIADIDTHVKTGVDVNPYDGDYQLNPIPNHNPHVNSPMLAGDQPSGMLSIPSPGAKVFVFFLGGDIQKPVYFANSLEPETIKKMGGYGTPNNKTGTVGTAWNAGIGPSSFELGHIDTSIGGVPYTQSSAGLGTGGTRVLFTPNNAELASQGDANVIVLGSFHKSAFSESVNVGSSNTNASNNMQVTVGFGSTPKEQKKIDESLQKLKKILDDVQKQKVEEIESNAKSGETVDCPLCSIKYATDKASAYSKKAVSLLRAILPPYFSMSIDVFQFLLTMIFIPFVAITNGSALGECGNPDCKGGKIPSPQKPIEEANRKAAETLVSKQGEIAELEQQMGNGGNYTVAVAKDFIISAGLSMNDSPCYAKTNNKSEPVKLKHSKDKATLHAGSADNLEGKMYTTPIQFPGGNVIIKGGNSVKIIAGSPGIELITKGKLSLNCGSLEILTSEGEMIVGSTNHTTLKGKVVTIDAEDGSNGGGINMNAPNTLIKGLSVSGNAAIKGSLKIEGELSCKYINTVGQRLQSDMAGSPDQRIPFGNWAIGSAQINDILNTIRTAVTHYLMPGAMLTLTNIIKFVMQTYNTIMTNTVIESITTGFGIGIGYVQMWNWQHNQLEDPKPIQVDYITPKGIYFDDGSGVDSNSNDPGPVPTRARKNGMGMDGGPKTLAGCGGFGNWGGGSGSKKGKLNSFGLGDVEGFTGTRLSDKNVKFEYNKDGSIKVNIDTSPC